MTDEKREQLIRYFRYTCLHRKRNKLIRHNVILIIAFLFFFFTLFVNKKFSSLTATQLFILFVLLLILGYNVILELMQIKKYWICFNTKKISENIQIEFGNIRRINTDRVACRVTVTDATGEIYIADFAEEILSDLFSNTSLEAGLDAYLIYVTGRKNELMAAYPVDDMDKNN
jgi:hypothetical protein